MKTITIFTPTYNRAYTLNQLYQSLCCQTSKDFEWLIVDDGSTDGTKALVEQWIMQNTIYIRYKYQRNGGKMRAHNKGVQMTESELFVCVDSDDYVVGNAVELILDAFRECKQECAGIVAYKGKNEVETMTGAIFPQMGYSTLDGLYRNGFSGDTTLVYRSFILKRHLFPDIKGEKFITENYIYAQIDQEYHLRVFPRIITICEYKADGYTNSGLKLMRDNPKGWAMYFNQKTQYENNLKSKMYFAAQYICYALLGNNKKIIFTAKSKVYTVLSFPFGIYLAWKRDHQYKKMKNKL